MEPSNSYMPQQEPNQYTPSFGQMNSNPMQNNPQPPVPPHHSPQPVRRVNAGDKIEQIIMLFYFFVAALLTFRFALGLFGARTTSPFVQFVYDISVPFMIPFEGMFGATPTAGYYSLEFEALVAIIVYAGVFFGLAQLVKILFK
jgi:YggT family protein